MINVPTTYPPEPLKGVMVTGMLAPGIESDFTYPAHLREDILKRIPEYVIEPPRDPDRFVRAEAFRRAAEGHERFTLHLMAAVEWDLLFVVFSVLDRAQHDYWADRDATHPRHDAHTPCELRDFIQESYVRLDQTAARVIEGLPAVCSSG